MLIFATLYRRRMPRWAHESPTRQRHGSFDFGAPHGRIHDLLSDATDLERDGAFQREIPLQTMEKILHGVFVWCFGFRDFDLMRARLAARLDGDEVVVVVTADGSVRTGDDEPTLGLGLDCPWIGERAPSGFEFGEPVFVASDNDAMFVNFETFGGIDRCSHFDGALASVIPGAESCAVAKVVQQRASSMSFLIKPGLGLFTRHLLGCFLLFVGTVPERTAITAEMPDIQDVANQSGLNQVVRFSMGGYPLQRPVYHEPLATAHGGDHLVSFFERSSEGFLHHDMRSEGSDFLDPLAMFGGGRAKNNHVRSGLFEARPVVCERALSRNAEFPHGFLHAFGLFVTDSDDLGLRMLGRVSQQITHVEVVEIYSRDSPTFILHDVR